MGVVLRRRADRGVGHKHRVDRFTDAYSRLVGTEEAGARLREDAGDDRGLIGPHVCRSRGDGTLFEERERDLIGADPEVRLQFPRWAVRRPVFHGGREDRADRGSAERVSMPLSSSAVSAA